MADFLDRLFLLIQYDPFEPMIFNSGFFMFLFLGCIVFYQVVVNNKRARILYLLIFSLYFYYKSSGIYFLLLIISSIIDYSAGKWIAETSSQAKKRLLLILSIVTNFGLLGYFKYTNFFINTFNDLNLGTFETSDIFLPVGISFFTFQSLSYTIDVYRGKLDWEKNFTDFLFFVSFFPQLVAGPIVRAKDFLPQIHKEIFVSKDDIARATFLIIAGLFKKAIIADYISINFVDRVFEMPLRYTGVENLLALYGYALQIYCDFSGYSDMAIGIALLLGFKLPINFDSPYKAATITEFWRRWHISLSSWLKDYLYISLGGNKKGKLKQYRNLMLTMLLGGLWHGAAWKFVVWGGVHGLALAVEKILNIPELVKKNRMLRVVGMLITFHIVCLCWVFFRAGTFQLGLDMINQILFFFHANVFIQFIDGYPSVLFLMIVGLLVHFTPKSLEIKTELLIGKLPVLGKAFLVAAVIWLVIQVQSSEMQPFIYFQF
ncbi:MAG: MBOAT family protein [Melioribacteraceae bacterium]|nr:MBOAT family protein [Melioribacteraceae bacterium]